MTRTKSAATWIIILAAAAFTVVVTTAAEKENNKSTSSVSGLIWSTAKDERDLLPNPESTAASTQDELDGGFSSLEGMLQWSIGHSDPAKLKETAQRLSPGELKDRQLELRELMQKMKIPSDAELMRVAIDDLSNSSVSLEDRHRALHELLILVEPIDNANDLDKLGGLVVVIRELNHTDAEVRRLSAWVLGKASQNNPIVQKQVLEYGALAKLMDMVKSSVVEEAIKALYAVSALIRNNLAGQELFFAESGDVMLQDILRNASIDIRLRRKAAFLVGDLAEGQLESKNAVLPFFSNHVFLKAVVDLTASTDLDLQEKALAAIKNLLQLRTSESLVFRDICGLDSALEKMGQQLKELMLDEDRRDYASDLEILRLEVELIFHRELAKVTTPI